MSAARKYRLKRKNVGKFMKQNEEHSLVLKLELRYVKRSRSDKCESGNGMGPNSTRDKIGASLEGERRALRSVAQKVLGHREPEMRRGNPRRGDIRGY